MPERLGEVRRRESPHGPLPFLLGALPRQREASQLLLDLREGGANARPLLTLIGGVLNPLTLPSSPFSPNGPL